MVVIIWYSRPSEALCMCNSCVKVNRTSLISYFSDRSAGADSACFCRNKSIHYLQEVVGSLKGDRHVRDNMKAVNKLCSQKLKLIISSVLLSFVVLIICHAQFSSDDKVQNTLQNGKR